MKLNSIGYIILLEFEIFEITNTDMPPEILLVNIIICYLLE